jgi:membrane protein implicated in regulation of membrane protease activity
MILRRLYLYLVSAAGLGLLAAGLALLGTTVLMFIFNAPNSSDPIYRTQLAGFTAMTLVALPVWGVHFWFARRFAMRDPDERASALRRLYLYAACLAAATASSAPEADMCTM